MSGRKSKIIKIEKNILQKELTERSPRHQNRNDRKETPTQTEALATPVVSISNRALNFAVCNGKLWQNLSLSKKSLYMHSQL